MIKSAAPNLEFLAEGGNTGAPTASEEHFRALFEAIDEGMSILQILFDDSDKAIDYRFLAVNRAHPAMTGMATEVVGKRISDVMPDIDPSVIQRLGKVALTGESARFEDYIRPLDRWYEVYLSRFGHPESRTVVAVFRDITERKRREHLQIFLLTLSDALRPLADPHEIQVLAADLLGAHLQVNQANYGEVWDEHVHIAHSYAKGLPPMVGSFHSDDFGKRLMEGHRAGRLQVCANTTSDPLFDEQERKALAAVHVGAYIAVPLVKEGVWVGVLSVLNILPRDWAPTEVEAVQEVAERTWAAVERTRAERALSRSEEKYRSLFESIDEGVSTIEVYFDLQDKAIDYKILEINAAHEAMSGLGREIIGKRIRELMPDVPKNLLERVGQVALTGQPIRFEEFVTGLNRWFDIYLTRDGSSESRRVISVSKNITERKRQEHLQVFLLTLSDALRPLVDPEQIQVIAADLLGEHLQVNHALYGEVRGEHTHVSHSYANGLAPMVGSFHNESFGKRMIEGHRAGRLQVCVNTTSDPLIDEEESKALAAVHVGAYIAVPLVKQGEWVAVLSVQNIQPRDWAPTEVEAVQEVAQRTWAAVERTRAERAMRRSEEKYRLLFDSIDEGVSTIEVYFDEQDKAIDFKVLEVNAAHEAMTGLGREVIGKRGREFISDLEQSMMERMGQVALTGQSIRFEEFVSGLGRWFDIYFSRDGGSDSRRVITVYNNITERKRRERHAAFLDKLSQTSSLLKSPDEIVRATGEALGAYLDVSSFHVIGVKLAPGDEPAEARFTALATWEREGLFAPSGAYRTVDYLSEEFLRATRAGEPVVVCDTDTDRRTDKDAYRAVGMRAFIAAPILKDDEWPGLISVGTHIVRDWRPDEVTLMVEVAHRVFPQFERVSAEAALRESEARLQALIENLPGGAVFVVDKDLRYLIAEGEAIAHAGLKSADFLGKSIRQALPEHLASEYEPYFRKGLAGEHYEYEHAAHEHAYLTRGVPLRTPSGEVYAVLAASFDITERKRAEGESREADKRKDEFLAMLSHELRNPLAAISNATQVMQHLTRDNATVQRPCEVIERQLQDLTRLVDDLLDMSRLTWGKINLKQEMLSLEAVLQRAIEGSRPLIDARGHQLTITLPPLAVQVAGDSTRLVQVFGNLLNNAAKYTEPGGHIALHTTIAGEEAIILVRDNGCGLSASLLPHVFELFTQAIRSLDRSQGGLGVGLALVSSLVKMHGGEVEAHSAGLGQGSEFMVRLPLVRSSDKLERPSSKEATAQASTIAPRLKILVVEDNADAAEMLSLLLCQGGDEVRLTHDGLTALDEARHFQPQVVLCDLGLPGLNGYGVAARLREQPEWRDTLLVALSGYGREEDLRKSQAAGFDHHLTKPVDFKVLAALLERRRLA